jgi:LCP family protein required for cell wall assembly
MGETNREWLLVRGADGAGARVELPSSPLRIGRALDNQVVLTDSYASAAHAELVQQKGRRCLQDLGSTNGTRLNGQPIPPRKPYALNDGDVIRIGDSELVYRVQVPAKNGRSESGATANGLAPAVDPAFDDGTRVLGMPSSVQPAVAPATRPPGKPVAQPAGKPARAPRRRIGVPFGRALLRLALVLVAVAALVGVAVWLLAPSRVVLLVLGSDARPDELRRGEGGRTDTLLTVVADRSPGSVGLVSIPRDLWVEIPGYGSERINTAYLFGGPRAAERVVGDTLGVPVDRYLVIGLQGVRDVVDAAGGVDIDVDVPIHDDAYPTDDYGTVVVDIPAGRQHMDGETALRYARTRHQDNDFGRMGRQQRVMVAVRSALLRPTNWWRIPAVLSAVRQTTQTDLGILDLTTLALAFGTASDEPTRLAIDLSLTQEFQGAGGAYLLRPTPLLRQRVSAFLTPTNAAVEVLNASSTTGLAKQAADRLQARGWRGVHVGDAGRSQAQTTIEARPGLSRAGQAVASALDLPRDAVRESGTLPADVDVRVTLGAGR